MVQRWGGRHATALPHGTCTRMCTNVGPRMCPECAGHARQQLPCSPVHMQRSNGPGCRRCQCPCGYGYTYIHTYIQTQLTAQRGVPANTGRRHCARTVQLWTLRRPVSHIDERVPYGSGQQRALRLGCTVLEEGRVRSLPVDPANQFRSPCQFCSHVGTILGRAPQFHAVGHARGYAGPEDEQFLCCTQVVAAQDRQPLTQFCPAVGRASCLLSSPASF